MDAFSKIRHIALPVLMLVCVSLYLMALVACGSSTEPGSGTGAFVFSPPTSALNFIVGQQQQFKAQIDSDSRLEAEWFRGQDQIWVGTVFDYTAGYVGPDSLRVVAQSDGKTSEFQWNLVVAPDDENLPPMVTGISISHGAAGGEVFVDWYRIPEAAVVYPIVEYVVAASTEGPISSETWATADILGTIESTGDLGYRASFNTIEHALTPGAWTYFAVRGRDQAGQMSPAEGLHTWEVSSPWWIEGHVYDDTGVGLHNVIVSYGCPECKTNTDSEGYYRLGPFRDFDTITLTTLSNDIAQPVEPYAAWYDLQIGPVEYEDNQQVDITLVTRYPLALDCYTSYAGGFMEYLTVVSGTRQQTNNRPNHRLYKWADYPVSVYVPAFVDPDDRDIGALATEAVGLWNTIMAQDVVVLTDSPESADIVFEFPYNPSYYGRTEVVEPEGDYVVGDVIPEKMIVSVNWNVPHAVFIKEVSLHELGHALGFARHSECNDSNPAVPGHLMEVSGSSGALSFGDLNAIHIDEQRAIRSIMALPNGTDMSLVEDFD